MLIADALDGVAVLGVLGEPVAVSGVQYDSRRVRPGDVFCAMRGGSFDGNGFVAAALGRGAAAVVTDSAEVFQAGLPVPVALVGMGGGRWRGWRRICWGIRSVGWP